MQKTLEFALKMDPDIANFSIALPFPGTEMFEIIKKEGHFLKQVELACFGGFYEGEAFFEVDPTKKQDVEEMYKKAYTVFYRRPKKILGLISSVRSFRELKWIIESTIYSQGFRLNKKNGN